MFSLQNSNTPVLSNPSATVNEVVKYVRSALTGVSKGANDPGIKNRSVDGFFKDEKVHLWKKTLDRRTHQKSCGFFARPDNKYKECGGVELENKRLVINSLRRIGNYFHAQEEENCTTTPREEENKEANHFLYHNHHKQNDTSHLKLVNSNRRHHRRYERENDVGMSMIKDRLARADRRITSVKAGQKLADYLIKEDEEKEEEWRRQQELFNQADMVMINPSSVKKHSNNIQSNVASGNISGVTGVGGESINNNNNNNNNKKQSLITSEDGCADDDDEQHEELVAASRNHRYFVKKLDHLITLFKITQNMRPRDLKTKTPLSVETLKNIRKSNYYENRRTGRLSIMSHRRESLSLMTPRHRDNTHNNNHNTYYTTHNNNHNTYNNNTHNNNYNTHNNHQNTHNGTSNTFNSKLLPPILNESTSRHSEVASPSILTTPRCRKTTMIPKQMKHFPVTTHSANRPETWDEFVSTETNNNTNRNEGNVFVLDPTLEPSKGHSKTGLLNNTTNNNNNNNNNYQGILKMPMSYKRQRNAPLASVKENVPLWHKIIQEQRDVGEKEIQHACSRNQGKTSSDKHEEILTSLVSGFENSKKHFSKKVEEELNGRSDAYQVQYESFGLSHLKEQDLKRMRNRVDEWRSLMNAETARPPVWVDELKKEQKELGLHNKNNNNNNNDDYQQINSKFQELSKYADIQSTPVLKAKLCLLVLSLPAYEVCQLPMQDAAKFFAKYVVETPEENIKEWMTSRKLVSNQL